MTRATGPAAEYPVTLSDGVNTIGLMLPSKTGIRQLPQGKGVERKVVRQADWSGGRGADRLANDTTRFYDAMNAWTMVAGQIVPGPLLKLTKTRDEVLADTPAGNFFWSRSSGKYARSFVAPASFTVRRVGVMVRVNDTAGPDVTVSIYTNVAGAPGAALWNGTLDTSAQDTIGNWKIFDPNLAITSGTTYWVVVNIPDNPQATRVVCGLDETAGLWDVAGDGWVAADFSPLFYLTAADMDVKRVHFFRYQQQLYAMQQRADGAASNLLINGDRGVVTGAGQTTTRMVDTSKTWTAGEWVGAVLYIVTGTNKAEYRTITASGTNYVDVSPALPAACVAASSVYVLLGSDKWTAITSGLAAACTSVAVQNSIVYFATGDGTVLRRMREYNNAGTWTREFADDGTNKAEILLAGPHHTDGTPGIYRANNDTSQASVAKQANWGTALTFETGLPVGNVETLITSLTRYDDQVWASKEDSIWSLDNGKFAEVEIGMNLARDERNGVAATAWNTNLFFSFMDGVERLYGHVVDDIGPNRDMGMPAGRRGRVAALQPFMQYLFAAYDGGAENVSAVLASLSPGGSWHEIARARESGQPMRSLFYQSVPGAANRLWVQHGADIGYLVMPDDTHNPINDAAMRYAPESYVTTAWIDLDSPELDHYFDEVRLMTRNLGYVDGNQERRVKVQYKVDVDDDALGVTSTAWTTFTEDVTVSPYAIRPIGNGAVTGRRIKLRLILTSDTRQPFILNWIEVRANQMNEVLYDYLFDFRAGDRQMLLNGNDTTVKAATVLAVLRSWQEVGTPLTLRVAMPGGASVLDNVRGHIDPVALVTARWNDAESELTGSITFKQT